MISFSIENLIFVIRLKDDGNKYARESCNNENI